MDPVVHKKHKIKFFQPLVSERNAVPLLHIQQIQDVTKIYQYKKKLLNVENQKPNRNWVPEEEKEIKIELSAEQRIQEYKKNQYEKAMNHKRGKFEQKEKKVRPKIYATPLRRFLKRMSNYSLNDGKSAYLHEIKESEKQLHFVKCNPTRKRRIPSTASSEFHRKRILSLQNGLPMEIGQVYPTLEQKIDQLKPPPPPPKLSLVESLERDIHHFFSQYQSKNTNAQSPNYLQYQKIKQQKLINKAKTNINRSVDTVQRMLTTMNGYYSMKKDHREEYSELISTWKVDRPKTNELRSRSYNVEMVSENRKKNLLDVFRRTSQNIRSNDLQRSKRFYNQLLDFILSKTKNIQAVPLTKAICDEIRQELELNLKLDVGFLTDLVIQIECSQEKDELVDEVLKRTKQYIQTCQ